MGRKRDESQKSSQRLEDPLGFAHWCCSGLRCEGDPSGTNFAPRILTFEAESDVVAPGAAVQIRLEVADLENDTFYHTHGLPQTVN